MILVDANIFMYAAGAEHPYKEASLRFLREVARGKEEALVDAQVLQEILHRYRAIGRWHEGRLAFDLARRVVPTVVPITAEIVDQARQLLDRHAGIMARQALHAAVYRQSGARAICSYDQDFDEIAGIQRIEPAPGAQRKR